MDTNEPRNKQFYAIKTDKGYLAAQGKQHWFQDAAAGWGIFSTEEHARDVAESCHSAIGTSGTGYTIVSVS